MFELNKGLQNKDKDASEQRVTMSFSSGVVGVSALMTLGIVGCSQTLLAVVSEASGLSAAPIVGLQIQRFVTGVGNTVIALNGSSLLTITAYSTSGLQTHAIPAANTSLLLQGDVLQAVTSTANSAATYNITAVLQVLQAVRTDYGV
jgi:hypothetical protein